MSTRTNKENCIEHLTVMFNAGLSCSPRSAALSVLLFRVSRWVPAAQDGLVEVLVRVSTKNMSRCQQCS